MTTLKRIKSFMTSNNINNQRPSSIFYDDEDTQPGGTKHLGNVVGRSVFYNEEVSSPSKNQTKEDIEYFEELKSPNLYWSDIDFVVKSGALDNMTSNRKVIQEVKFEIITSELNYLNSLNVLLTTFYKSELSRCCTQEEWQTLFGNLKSVKSATEYLLNDLVGHWEADVMLDGIYEILRFHASSSLRVYQDYCANLTKAIQTLEALLSKNTRFEKELDNIGYNQGQSLNSLITLPMQRVTRLPLLLEAVIIKLSPDTQEYKECKLALFTLKQLTKSCNEMI